MADRDKDLEFSPGEEEDDGKFSYTSPSRLARDSAQVADGAFDIAEISDDDQPVVSEKFSYTSPSRERKDGQDTTDVPRYADTGQVVDYVKQDPNLSYITKPPPSSVDLSPVIAQAMGVLQDNISKSENMGEFMNAIMQAPQDILQIPELMGYMVDYYSAVTDDSGAMISTLEYGTLQNVIAALYANTGEAGFTPVAGAALDGQNVVVFYDEHGANMSPEMNDFTMGVFGGVPKTSGGDNFLSSDAYKIFRGAFSKILPVVSLAMPAIDLRDYQEELAADATLYLRGKPIDSPTDEREFVVWFFQRAQLKTMEAKARASHLGVFASGLDVPVQQVKLGANTIYNKIVFPNDQLNRNRISFMQNVSYGSGMHITDEPGSSILNHPLARPFVNILKYGIVHVAMPGLIPITIARVVTGDEEDRFADAFTTPFVTPILEELESANTFELVSGVGDALMYLADPLTAMASVGFGVKAARVIPRLSNMSRARLILNAARPFSGFTQATGARGTIITRITWATKAKFVNEMIDAAPNTIKGNRLYTVLRDSSSTGEAMRRIPVLADNPATPVLMAMAKRGDKEAFWESFRGFMLGASETGNPNDFDNLRSIINAAESDLQRAANRALNDGAIGIRDVKLGELGSRSDSIMLEVGTKTEGVEVLRPAAAATEGNGEQKILVNTLLRWTEEDAFSPDLIRWLSEGGEGDLAAKLSLMPEVGLADGGGTSLRFTPDELRTLQRFIDNVSDADALRLGDELIVGSTSQKKLLRGADLADPIDVAKVLPEDWERAAGAYFMKQFLGGKHREITLINRMPTVKSSVRNLDRVAAWTRLSGQGRVAQFARRFKSGVSTTVPGDVNFMKPRQGAIDIRRMMDLAGTRKEVIDDMMTRWWKLGTTAEDRRLLTREAFKLVGDDIDSPHIRHGFITWPERHGLQDYLTDASGKPVGLAKDDDELEYVASVVRALFQDSIPIPNMMEVRRANARYRRAKLLPRRIQAGWGKTNEARDTLVQAYRTELTRQHGLAEGIAKLSDDELLTIAYSDVMGFGKRESGLGLANKIATVGGRAYGAFHSMFTIAQLAFRPFAWASRVLLEEHARAWMMGLPSMMRDPVQYGIKFWDNHLINETKRRVIRQRRSAVVSANDFFGEGADLAAGIARADEMMPGWSAGLKRSKIDLEDSFALKGQWTHDLDNALGAGKMVDLSSRGNLAQRVMRRQKRLDSVIERHDKIYGIDPREWEFMDDVPEMMNKFNVWFISDEMQSSIKKVDFLTNTRKGDITIFAHTYEKKAQQLINDRGVAYAIRRMLEKMGGGVGEHTAEGFARTAIWRDVRENVIDVARYRGLDDLSEIELVRLYLDEIIAEDIIISMFSPMWGGNHTEKFRILSELSGKRALTLDVNGTMHTLSLGKENYSSAKPAWAQMFHDQAAVGNFNFPSVSGVFNPLYGNPGGLTANARVNLPRRWTNWILQTFGEDVSQALHRRPAYLAERARVKGIYERIGWSTEDANAVAHQKAFEVVNYTFFNNQHTGILLHRMNKVVPFFSAWAEVISTWAWKIPSQNFLPLGYARMIHRTDVIMQGWVKLGLVSIDDNGQWVLNLESTPSQQSAVGRGLSRAMFSAVQTPITVVEHTANFARLMSAEVTEEEYEPVDWTAWKKDNYQLAIGSPVAINSRGIMGVNQLQFGMNPAISYGSSEVMKRAPFAADTALIEGATLADLYEQLPADVGIGQFLETNERVLLEKLGPEKYNQLFDRGGEFLRPEDVDVTGLSLQVPGSSWLDGVLGGTLGDTIYPFGSIDTPAGVIRSLVPSTFSYLFRGMGLYVDDGGVEGIINILTGPVEQAQIDAEQARQIIHLEASEGLVSKAGAISEEIYKLAEEHFFSSPEEMRKNVTPGSDESKKLAELDARLAKIDDEITKRSTDNTAFAFVARFIMGFLGPATPRMFFEEQKVTGQWWAAREMAEAAQVRGSVDWATALNDVKIEDEEDMIRIIGSVAQWISDPNGSSAKVWFNRNYPSMMAWLQPTTFWGPAGAPPLVRDIDAYFDAVKLGNRQVYPNDVLVQRLNRAAVDVTYETDMIMQSGTNNMDEQGVWAVSNWGQYQMMRDERRFRFKALEMWDSELNDGAYLDWVDRNIDDPPSALERVEEAMFNLQDAADDIFALMDLADIFDVGELELLEGKVNATLNQYSDVLREVHEEIRGMPEFYNGREEMIFTYFEQVTTPFYEILGNIYLGLRTAERAADRALVFEEVRNEENGQWATSPEVTIGDVSYKVPNELQRAWDARSPDSQRVQIQRWTGRPVEWLSQFAIAQIIDDFPTAAEYLPTQADAQTLFNNATIAKTKIRKNASENVETVSSYDRTQQLDEVDEWLRGELVDLGYVGQAQWLDAWPIERLMLTGQLPPALRDVGEWYLGIKQLLESNDPRKGPGSELGRRYFNGLGDYLDNVYFPANSAAEDALDLLGEEMFSEGGRWKVYARLYGATQGEVD